MNEAVRVIADPGQAQALLDPTRLQILERLGSPASAAGLAQQLDLPRQRLNYHLRELERQGLVSLLHARQRGSVTERVYQRAGDSFAISVDAIGALGSRPANMQDRFSSAYQIAVASQAIADLAALRAGAAAAQKTLPTMTIEVDVRFADAAARSSFAQELADAVAALASRYHDESAPDGRTFKFYLGAYPKPSPPAPGAEP
ncbi:MAG TPA: helix-turn-helix domain-containing protein [Planctomycetota bacterium]|nr:helix-turn-helix domain-containing protein [Planctomycetota bacterium]